jgi:Phage integrase family
MQRIARNLYLHPNRTYYAIFGGKPKSLKTWSRSEANQLLKGLRANCVAEKHSRDRRADTTQTASGTEAGLFALVTSMRDEMRDMRLKMDAQSAQIATLGVAQQAPASPLLVAVPDPDFSKFFAASVRTVCHTGSEDTKRMHRLSARKCLSALEVHRRAHRIKNHRDGKTAPEYTLWDVLRELGPDGIWSYWHDRQALGGSGCNHLRVFLSHLIEDCCDRNILADRYLRRLEKIKILDVPPALPTIPTPEEMRLLVRACRAVCNESAQFIEGLVYTGARPGGLAELKWSDVRLPQGTATFVQDKKRPEVTLSVEAVELFREIKGDRSNPTGTVFGVNDYKIGKARRLLNRCALALVKAGHHDLKDMTDLKALRHYFASVCIMSGIDAKTIAVLLGHGDGGALVSRVYGHLANGHVKSQVAKIRLTAPQAAEEIETPLPISEECRQAVARSST